MINLGKGCELNLEKLIATRMILCANSGGGKSWAIRRLLEQSYGQVQQVLIDLEGEFSSLREKYDYLLVGKDGEIPANIRTAEILAKRLLELNVSTIIDLSELKHPERITFVKRFLDSLINSPKELWHPVLVIIDEAHVFAPEQSKSESSSAVIDLMTRGRKRGIAGILATQRISKLNKDAIAECNNYMIGRTGLDIDMKRASDVLGFTTKEDFRSLRDLKAGQFYTFGSAFQHDGVEKFMVDKVQTTHPDRTRGIEITKPVETPENIKKLLKDLTNLPKEAEEELRSVEDMKKKIRELKYQLTIAEKSKPVVKVDDDLIWKSYVKGTKESNQKYEATLKSSEEYIRKLKAFIERITREGNTIITSKEPTISIIKQTYEMPKQIKAIIPTREIIYPTENVEGTLKAGAMKMLNWLAGAHPNTLTISRLSTLSGFSQNGGTFKNYISQLKKNGWITGTENLIATEEGLKNARAEEIPTGEELLRLWQTKFKKGAGKILEILYTTYPESISTQIIGEQVGFEPTGGTFKNYISQLRRNNLINIEGNEIKISEEFFE